MSSAIPVHAAPPNSVSGNTRCTTTGSVTTCMQSGHLSPGGGGGQITTSQNDGSPRTTIKCVGSPGFKALMTSFGNTC
jgi:hypothetical protein